VQHRKHGHCNGTIQSTDLQIHLKLFLIRMELGARSRAGRVENNRGKGNQEEENLGEGADITKNIRRKETSRDGGLESSVAEPPHF
jgi:hypothetical protein